jgi:signal transduction histidine kinase
VSIRLSITKKGLLIVAVPLLFQIFFVALLLNELERSEKETMAEVHARRIISAVDQLFVHAYEASGALYMYAYTVSDEQGDEFDRNIKLMRADLRFIRENSAHDKNKFASLEREIESGIEKLKEQKRMIAAGQHPGSMVERLQGYTRVRKIVHGATAVAGVELGIYQKKQPRTFDERKWAVRRVIIIGLIGNVIVALFIANFFGKSIVQRLKRVLTNLDLFAKRQPLLPPMVVTDEIGIVDEAFHEMADNLRKAERMKQDFVAMIGHDIRTPATTIKTTLDMLDEEATEKLDGSMRELVTDAAGESRRLMTLTNNLLDLSQIETGQFQIDPRPIGIADAVKQSVRSLALYAQSKKATLKTEVAEYKVQADYDRILQVLINLLSNAVKYSPRGSEIIVSAAKTDDGFIEIVIEDNGPGIPAADREKVFAAYERLGDHKEEEQRGMGLGLAICSSIVKAHGGTIGVRESRAGGSAFWFKLPIAVGTKVEDES